MTGGCQTITNMSRRPKWAFVHNKFPKSKGYTPVLLNILKLTINLSHYFPTSHIRTGDYTFHEGMNYYIWLCPSHSKLWQYTSCFSEAPSNGSPSFPEAGGNSPSYKTVITPMSLWANTGLNDGTHLFFLFMCFLLTSKITDLSSSSSSWCN